jgi:hypothetical protein
MVTDEEGNSVRESVSGGRESERIRKSTKSYQRKYKVIITKTLISRMIPEVRVIFPATKSRCGRIVAITGTIFCLNVPIV